MKDHMCGGGSPLSKTHMEQKFFVRALETCHIKEREIVKISANVVTFKCHVWEGRG